MKFKRKQLTEKALCDIFDNLSEGQEMLVRPAYYKEFMKIVSYEYSDKAKAVIFIWDYPMSVMYKDIVEIEIKA